MDGPVIQEASRRALEDGATPSSVLGAIKEAGLEVPVAVMTYANPVWHAGHGAFLAACVDAGVTGVIVPDLPVDEAERLDRRVPASLGGPGLPGGARHLGRPAAARSATPRGGSSTAWRRTGSRARGTGWPRRPRELVGRLRPLTSRPLLVGVGIAEPSQAAEACAFADGVVVGSALVRPLLDGDTATALGLARAFRAATPS